MQRGDLESGFLLYHTDELQVNVQDERKVSYSDDKNSFSHSYWSNFVQILSSLVYKHVHEANLLKAKAPSRTKHVPKKLCCTPILATLQDPHHHPLPIAPVPSTDRPQHRTPPYPKTPHSRARACHRLLCDACRLPKSRGHRQNGASVSQKPAVSRPDCLRLVAMASRRMLAAVLPQPSVLLVLFVFIKT